MSSFEKYAEYYDLIYRDKDYEKECDFIEEACRGFASTPVKTILDGGCGTGGHAIPLVKRGYQVSGLDSSPVMLQRARQKVGENRLKVQFHLGDLRRFDLGKKFDAVICMFAVMSYVTETEDVLGTLKNIRKHLNAGSLFIFDFWNGLAVLRLLPSTKVQTFEDSNVKIIRIAQPELDALNHLCLVHYRLLVNRDNAMIDEIAETHVIRYFFPQEIKHYLQDSGFELLKICPFPDLRGKADENVWNIAAVAKAI